MRHAFIPALAAPSVLRATRSVSFQQGAAVFVQGSAGRGAYLIVAGKIKLTQHTDTGDSNVLVILGPGEVFGELSLFDSGPRPISAHAVTSATLNVLDRHDLDELLQTDPDVAAWMVRQLARRLQRANDAATHLTFSDVPARVAQVLLDLAEQFGHEAGGVVLLDHGLTQSELARLAGTSRESGNKALASFVARGWITVDKGSACIIDSTALIRRAGRVGENAGGPVSA